LPGQVASLAHAAELLRRDVGRTADQRAGSPGYEGTTSRDWDANWLNVRGKVAQADGKT
jgi:hypothetical protein